MNNGEWESNRPLSYPGDKKSNEEFDAQQKRADVEAELKEAKLDSDIESFSHFVRDQGMGGDQFTDDELAYFIAWDSIEQYTQEENLGRENRLRELYKTWEKEKEKPANKE